MVNALAETDFDGSVFRQDEILPTTKKVEIHRLGGAADTENSRQDRRAGSKRDGQSDELISGQAANRAILAGCRGTGMAAIAIKSGRGNGCRKSSAQYPRGLVISDPCFAFGIHTQARGFGNLDALQCHLDRLRDAGGGVHAVQLEDEAAIPVQKARRL